MKVTAETSNQPQAYFNTNADFLAYTIRRSLTVNAVRMLLPDWRDPRQNNFPKRPAIL